MLLESKQLSVKDMAANGRLSVTALPLWLGWLSVPYASLGKSRRHQPDGREQVRVRIGLAAATVEDARDGSSMVVWPPVMPATCSDPEGEKMIIGGRMDPEEWKGRLEISGLFRKKHDIIEGFMNNNFRK